MTNNTRSTGDVMLSAYNLFPDAVKGQPARMRWIAEYFLKHYAPIAPTADAQPVATDLATHVRRMRKDESRGDEVFRCGFNGAIDAVLKLIESAAPTEKVTADAGDERAAFEACASKSGYGDFRRDPANQDDYLIDEVQSAWAVWQVRSLTAQPSDAAAEPIYQLQLATGDWRDQSESSYRYNAQHPSNVIRIVYAAPQALPFDAAACVCGSPLTLGTVHRTDGPCYVSQAVEQPLSVNDAMLAFREALVERKWSVTAGEISEVLGRARALLQSTPTASDSATASGKEAQS